MLADIIFLLSSRCDSFRLEAGLLCSAPTYAFSISEFSAYHVLLHDLQHKPLSCPVLVGKPNPGIKHHTVYYGIPLQ